MLGFGGALTAHGMVGYLANNVDNILIGRYWGDFALGVYSTSYNLMMRPISLAGYGVGEAAIPALSRASSSPDELKRTFRRMFEVTCLLGLPICIAGAIWTYDIVHVVLGHQWESATPVLRWLFIAALPRMLGVCTGWVYVATGRPGRMLTWQMIWTPFVVLAFILGLSRGAEGVAAAYAIVNWIGVVPNFVYCLRGTPITARDLYGPLARPLACTVLCVAIGTIVSILIPSPESDADGRQRLAVEFLVAVAAYLVATAMFIPFIHAKLTGLLARRSRASRT